MRLKGLSVGVEVITVALTKSFVEPGQKRWTDNEKCWDKPENEAQQGCI